MGLAGQPAMRARFDPDAYLARLERLYATLLGERR